MTIGVFDAIHRGHQAIISECVRLAGERGLPSLVLTFDRNPRQVVSGQSPCLITPRPKKVELIGAMGVDYLVVVEFSREFSSLSPQRFCHMVLGEHLRACGVCVGENFHFGAGGRGDVGTLEKEGGMIGFDVTVIPLVSTEEGPLSSTLVRQLISRGKVEHVMADLGRPYTMTGRVVTGHSRGKALGFPTANIRMESNYCMPADGVYAGKAYVGDRKYPSAINIGDNPTFGDEEAAVEVFLLDFDDEIYGESMKVEFFQRLRSEIAFKSDRDLINQITEDVQKVRSLMCDSTGL